VEWGLIIGGKQTFFVGQSFCALQGFQDAFIM
jgi:hypothetical protein